MVTIQYVTVVRDDTEGLLKTVNSILNQTYPHIKHLILDGSSKTSLDRLPSGYQTRDPDQVYVQELDLGIYNAMNKWFNSNSKPNLVCWLNAGDILPKEHTASLVARDFLKRNWKWAYGNLNLVDASGQIQHSPNQTPFKKRSFEMGMRWIPHEASYFQLDFLKEVGQYNEKMGVYNNPIIMYPMVSRRYTHNLQIKLFHLHHLYRLHQQLTFYFIRTLVYISYILTIFF